MYGIYTADKFGTEDKNLNVRQLKAVFYLVA